MWRPILSDFAAIRSDVSIRSCRGGISFFQLTYMFLMVLKLAAQVLTKKRKQKTFSLALRQLLAQGQSTRKANTGFVPNPALWAPLKGNRDKLNKALSSPQAFHCLSFVAAGQALRAIKVNVIARDKWHYVRAEGLTRLHSPHPSKLIVLVLYYRPLPRRGE